MSEPLLCWAPWLIRRQPSHPGHPWGGSTSPGGMLLVFDAEPFPPKVTLFVQQGWEHLQNILGED